MLGGYTLRRALWIGYLRGKTSRHVKHQIQGPPSFVTFSNLHHVAIRYDQITKELNKERLKLRKEQKI